MADFDSAGALNEAEDDVIYEVDDGDQSNVQFDPIVPAVMQSTPPMALMALKITLQPWNNLGHGSDPNVAASSDMTITVERITSLFLIRIVAIVCHRNWQLPSPNPKIPKYSDISTTLICTEALKLKRPWPKPITKNLIQQIRGFVRSILKKYNDVHYHSFEHAYHVTISLHKLMDMMLMNEASVIDISAAKKIFDNSAASDGTSGSLNFGEASPHHQYRKSYGLRNDPLMAMAMLFSALVHDVEHRGVPNRQLVQESHELAILYNDQSVAEQRSLAVAFSELMKEEFQELRDVMFEDADEYRRFRKAVINTVLATDLASPERTQLVKSMWKEAFGETSESKERKKIKEMSRRSLFTNTKTSKGSERTASSLPLNLRDTRNYKPSQITGVAIRRRLSNERSVTSGGVSSASLVSDLTFDYGLAMHQSIVGQRGDDLLSNIDDESDDASTAATPESSVGLDSFDLEDDEDITPEKSPVRGISPPAPTTKKIPTTISPKRGKSIVVAAEDPQLDRPNMIRQSTDSFVPSVMMTAETKVARETRNRSRRHSPKMNRRSSNPESIKSDKSYSVRLSIRRSLDLTGEAIDNYSRSTKTVVSSYQPSNLNNSGDYQESLTSDFDDTDELKAYVVMEHLIRAADVGANMQGWQQMKKWSNRLFFELKATHDVNRGEDPQVNWFENQITFLESYIMPLARRLNDVGVFGDSIGPMFEKIVQQNREQWLSEGLAATAHIVQEWQISKGEKHRLNKGW